MDNFNILKKELSYYGINLTEDLNCKICSNGQTKIQSLKRTRDQVKRKIESHRRILLSLWDEVMALLKISENRDFLIDDKMMNLFIFSLKDLSKFLLCFEGMEKSEFYRGIEDSLNRDILEFSKEQIYRLPDYKISIDWAYRLICRLIYINKLLYIVENPKKSSSKNTIKTARSISGPWANLDLPLEERVYPFEGSVQEREKDKKRQRRYTKGFKDYNGAGGVSEGHYWREIRNEPFLWENRSWDSPYPSRHMLSKWR